MIINDGTKVEFLDSYKEKFTTMIDSLRKDIDAEDVPLIIGELSDKSHSKCFAEYKKFVSERVEIRTFITLPDESKQIRETVFVHEQGFEEEFDTVDNYAIHFVAYDLFGNPVGTCRIFTESEPSVYYLGRLAVLRDFRGMDVGKKLVSKAEEYSRSQGGKILKLHSQCRAKSFYEKCGFSQYGEIDYEEGCPHIWMLKSLQ